MRATFVLLALVLSASIARAQEAVHEEAEHEHEHHHSNHVAIFAGATTAFVEGKHETSVTVGADYERRLDVIDHRLGVGALVDSAIGDATHTLLAPFVAFHPFGGLMLLGAVGVAFGGFGKDGHLALRGGAAYFVHVGNFSVGPEINFDHVSGENALVYGASVGMGF